MVCLKCRIPGLLLALSLGCSYMSCVIFERDMRFAVMTWGGESIDLRGFTDSSWGDCLDARRSSIGDCYTLGGGVISWSAKKQKVVATSSTKAKYITTSESCKEGLWLCMMLSLIPLPSKTITDAVPLYCNNNGAVCLAIPF